VCRPWIILAIGIVENILLSCITIFGSGEREVHAGIHVYDENVQLNHTCACFCGCIDSSTPTAERAERSSQVDDSKQKKTVCMEIVEMVSFYIAF
jgi:hypothetical protein